MDQHTPLLQIHGPDGQSSVFVMNEDRIRIGRFASDNDIGLEPDLDRFVSRHHCEMEHHDGAWWVVDMKSHNRTLIRRNGKVEVINESAPLADGDTILILARIDEGGQRLYWQLTFTDPLATQPAPGGPVATYLEYDPVLARLFRVLNGQREEICGLRPKEHQLIAYMVERANSQKSPEMMFSYDELIAVLWEDELFHENNEISRLVHELRKKIEVDDEHPRFLETVTGRGYRLVMRPPVWSIGSEQINGRETNQDEGNEGAR